MVKKKEFKKYCKRCHKKVKSLGKWRGFHFCQKCCDEAEADTRMGSTPMQNAFIGKLKGLQI